MEPITDGTTRQGKLSRAGGAVDEFIVGVKDQALEMKEEYLDEGWNKTRDFVVTNPGKAILISAAVGVLLGSLLVRRR
ncbi:MAG TPA: hypothetical protein VFB67_11025 [Candidatus Polarisedimenticolaceae bacterium]|nr:hypothetical protein [Candidatus Polarisedimenticolaceae bacterium]